MQVRITFAALFACLALSAAAQPVITGISPNSGPSAGGTVVTITGSGFAVCPICSPPLPPPVYFGGTYAPDTGIIDDKTLRVVVPAHVPGTVDVTVDQWNGESTLPDAFTFTGTLEDGFDRILLPLFTRPVVGAHGSRFITELRLATTSPTGGARVYGLCNPSGCAGDLTEEPWNIYTVEPQLPNRFEYRGKPGAFLLKAKSEPHFTANLRVFDETRSAFNFGTEMPVVHEREFTTEPIKLLGVPLDPRFRNTLRIYATAETSATVKVGEITHVVHVRGGETIFDPAYAQFSNFPIAMDTVDVTITPSTTVPPVPGFVPPKVWAFISVTNNETGLITTITPQPR